MGLLTLSITGFEHQIKLTDTLRSIFCQLQEPPCNAVGHLSIDALRALLSQASRIFSLRTSMLRLLLLEIRHDLFHHTELLIKRTRTRRIGRGNVCLRRSDFWRILKVCSIFVDFGTHWHAGALVQHACGRILCWNMRFLMVFFISR